MKGRASYMMGDYDEAVRSFYKAIELDRANTEYWYNRGIALSGRGQYDLAIEHFDKVIQMKPAMEKAWSSRGYAYVMEKNYPEALFSFEEALKINPGNAENWINKASVLRVLGRTDEADIAIGQANLLYKKQGEDIARKIPKTPISIVP
jgi:tetratricopeptide (TPR) repeat protein